MTAIRTCGCCGPNVIENLGHILQGCPRTHGPRIRRHDRILILAAEMWRRKGFCVEMELRIPTSIGLRKPDLLVYKPGQEAWVIDATVVSDKFTDLDIPHRQKMKYYDLPEIIAVAECKAGVAPSFSSITLNWRGIYSPGSARDLRLLQLTTADLRFLAAVCVEQGVIIHRLHQKSTVAIGSHSEI